MLNKCLPNISSYSVAHEILTAQGFKKLGDGTNQIYEAIFTDTATQIRYYFYVPTRINRIDESKINFGKVYFDRSQIGVPPAIVWAAIEKLLEIADYLAHFKKKDHNVRDHIKRVEML
jgi:hypothetical protein